MVSDVKRFLAFSRRREALIPGCDKRCRLSNTARRIVEGTRGRVRPRETSQRVLLECGIGTYFTCKKVEEVKRLLRTFAPKSSYGEIFLISPLELGHKVLTPKMEKKWGSLTLFRRKWQWKNVLISINRS